MSSGEVITMCGCHANATSTPIVGECVSYAAAGISICILYEKMELQKKVHVIKTLEVLDLDRPTDH